MLLSRLIAYVDGSYDAKTMYYSCGCIFLVNNQVIHHYNGVDNKEELRGMRNVAGEILGATYAIQYALDNGYDEIEIHYDYQGIQSWANRSWKANKIGTQEYRDFVEKARRDIKINYVKEKAHSNVLYNEVADNLAKKALNIKYNEKLLKEVLSVSGN